MQEQFWHCSTDQSNADSSWQLMAEERCLYCQQCIDKWYIKEIETFSLFSVSGVKFLLGIPTLRLQQKVQAAHQRSSEPSVRPQLKHLWKQEVYKLASQRSCKKGAVCAREFGCPQCYVTKHEVSTRNPGRGKLFLCVKLSAHLGWLTAPFRSFTMPFSGRNALVKQSKISSPNSQKLSGRLVHQPVTFILLPLDLAHTGSRLFI